MTSRKLTYPLIAIVLGVWGGVVYRLLHATARQPDAQELAAEPARLSAAAEAEPLLLDYRDPFLGEMSGRILEDIPSTVQPLPPAPALREQIVLSCQGRLRKGRREYFLISIGGMQQMIGRDETVEGFSIRRTTPDSLYLVKNGQEYSIPFN